MKKLRAEIEIDIQANLTENSDSLTSEELEKIKETLQIEVETKEQFASTDGEHVFNLLQKTAKKIARAVCLPNLKNELKNHRSIAVNYPALRNWVTLFLKDLKTSEENIEKIKKLGRMKKPLTSDHLNGIMKGLDIDQLCCYFICAVESIHPKLNILERQQVFQDDLIEGNFLYEVLKLVITELDSSESISAFTEKWAAVYRIDEEGTSFTQTIRDILNKQLPYHKAVLEKILKNNPDDPKELRRQTMQEAYDKKVIDHRIDLYLRLNPIIHMLDAAEKASITPLTFEKALAILHGFNPLSLKPMEYSDDDEREILATNKLKHKTQTEAIFELFYASLNPLKASKKAIDSTLTSINYLIDLSKAVVLNT